MPWTPQPQPPGQAENLTMSNTRATIHARCTDADLHPIQSALDRMAEIPGVWTIYVFYFSPLQPWNPGLMVRVYLARPLDSDQVVDKAQVVKEVLPFLYNRNKPDEEPDERGYMIRHQAGAVFEFYAEWITRPDVALMGGAKSPNADLWQQHGLPAKLHPACDAALGPILDALNVLGDNKAAVKAVFDEALFQKYELPLRTPGFQQAIRFKRS